MTHSEGRHADEHPMVLEFGTEQTEAAGDWLALRPPVAADRVAE